MDGWIGGFFVVRAYHTILFTEEKKMKMKKGREVKGREMKRRRGGELHR